MYTVLLVILMIVAVAMIGVILLQRSEGGALGIGGSGGGIMSARGKANLLTRTTAILATIFMGLCLLLGVLAGHRERPESLVDQIGSSDTKALETPVVEQPASADPKAPPAVPLGQ